jgi:phenylacetate-CoA ligase
MDVYDALEARDPADREADLFSRLPAVVKAAMRAPAYAERLAGVDPAAVVSREALVRLPVLRKSELPALHKASPPFGGFVAEPLKTFARLFTSPGPIFEPERAGSDPWGAARALHAMGFRAGDVVLNTFGYHLTPGGFIMDSGLRALRLRGDPGRARADRPAARSHRAFRPAGYCGTPDFLKLLLDARGRGRARRHLHSQGAVLGAAFPPRSKADISARGRRGLIRPYATADLA